MKVLLAFILTIVVLSASAANEAVVWEKPYYVSTSISRFNLQSVEFYDSATIVKAQIKDPEMIVSSDLHLCGEDGKDYLLKYCKEFALDAPIPEYENGDVTMTLVFEPLPLTTTFFDMLEGLAVSQCRVMGISDANSPVQVKPYALNEMKTNELRKDFFSEKTAYIKGKVNGYALSNGVTSLDFFLDNNLTGESEPVSLKIKDDGTFEQKIDIHYPVLNYLKSENGQFTIPFVIKPGETLNFDIRWQGSPEVKVKITDASGKPAQFSALSTFMPQYSTDSRYKALQDNVKLGFKNYIKKVEEAYNAAIATHNYLAMRYHYNDMEYLIGKLEMQYAYAEKAMEYCEDKEMTLAYLYNKELPDSVDEYLNLANYGFLRNIPFNDLLSMCVPKFYSFRASYWNLIGLKANAYRSSERDSVMISLDREMWSGNTMSLPLKLGYLSDFYKEGRGGVHNYVNVSSMLLNEYSVEELDGEIGKRLDFVKNRASIVKAEMHDAMFENLLDKYVDYGINDRTLTYTLPDCEATTILRKITDKYKGKYVYLDFWATFCAPCRKGIEQSKAWREELRNNPDFEFVYITSDKNSPKTTYEEYVAQNLDGAESYRIPDEDYKKLTVLFKFSGIPHHEALDPNGNVLKVNNTYYEGKDVFLRKIESMKRM